MLCRNRTQRQPTDRQQWRVSRKAWGQPNALGERSQSLLTLKDHGLMRHGSRVFDGRESKHGKRRIALKLWQSLYASRN